MPQLVKMLKLFYKFQNINTIFFFSKAKKNEDLKTEIDS